MNLDVRPPLYAYQEAFKTQIVSRVNRFSDTEYNEMVQLMGSAYALRDEHYFAITSNKPSRLKTLIKNTGVLQPANIAVLSGRINLQYPLNKNGITERNKELKIAQEIIENGPIIDYDPDNKLRGRFLNGKSAKGLTLVENESNTEYEDKDTGEKRVVNRETAQNIDQLLSNSESEKKTAQTNNYIMIGVIAVAAIIMVWTVKKNK